MEEIECQHKDKCSSYPNKCKSCKHNPGKKDYYEPDYFEPFDYYHPRIHYCRR